MFICPMDSDSGGEKRLISVRARGGEINECRDVICNICMVGSSYWGCDYEKTTTRNMDIISGLGCSRMYVIENEKIKKEDAEAMSDEEMQKQYTDEKVYFKATVTISDVMEDIYLDITA